MSETPASALIVEAVERMLRDTDDVEAGVFTDEYYRREAEAVIELLRESGVELVDAARTQPEQPVQTAGEDVIHEPRRTPPPCDNCGHAYGEHTGRSYMPRGGIGPTDRFDWGGGCSNPGDGIHSCPCAQWLAHRDPSDSGGTEGG